MRDKDARISDLFRLLVNSDAGILKVIGRNAAGDVLNAIVVMDQETARDLLPIIAAREKEWDKDREA